MTEHEIFQWILMHAAVEAFIYTSNNFGILPENQTVCPSF